jgi:hypothetical protein
VPDLRVPHSSEGSTACPPSGFSRSRHLDAACVPFLALTPVLRHFYPKCQPFYLRICVFSDIAVLGAVASRDLHQRPSRTPSISISCFFFWGVCSMSCPTSHPLLKYVVSIRIRYSAPTNKPSGRYSISPLFRWRAACVNRLFLIYETVSCSNLDICSQWIVLFSE